MADATLNTKFSRRTILAGGTAAVSILAASALGAPAPSPTPPRSFDRLRMRAGEGLFASAAPTLLSPPPPAGDVRLSVLAGEYRRALAALHAWIDLAEARDGICACNSPPWRDRHDALCARADGLVAEIALIRPNSIFGLAVKLRAGVYYDYDEVVPLEYDQRLLGPVLDDLDRMAEAALIGAAG